MATKPKPKANKTPRLDFELRGGNGLTFNSTEQEVICSGPAETGKTVACILKAHAICGTVAGAQGAIVRKAYNSLVGSVVKTYLRIVQPEKRGMQIFGGEKPERFIYPNGSTIWMGGMDNPSRVLSSERDFIYVNQAEELKLDDWETLVTRCTGRGAVIQHAQLYGDANPAGSMHWIRKRAGEIAADGKPKLRLIPTVHADNPSLYTREGILTEQGVRSLAALDNLTGVRRKRLLEGIWATAEGAVYDMFDPALHVLIRDPNEMKRWFLAIDEGYTNPAVILLIGEDGDKRMHCFREFYKRGVLQADFVAQAKLWFYNPFGYALAMPGTHPVKLIPKCERAAVDESAAGLIADLNNAGVFSTGAKGRVLDGINLVQNRLKKQGDGRARYTVDPSCVNHINEFESYIWKAEKDVPEKENDHTLDSVRYLLDYLHEGTGAFSSTADLTTHGGGRESSGMEFERISTRLGNFF